VPYPLKIGREAVVTAFPWQVRERRRPNELTFGQVALTVYLEKQGFWAVLRQPLDGHTVAIPLTPGLDRQMYADLQELIDDVEHRVSEKLGMSTTEYLGLRFGIKQNPSAKAAFFALLTQRWEDACRAVRLPREEFLTWDIGDYPHFHSARGYAVMIPLPGNRKCHLRFAAKILQASVPRQDGLIRHELGHVLDTLIPGEALDHWAAGHAKIFLPKTPERRADSIAEAVWGTKLGYDQDTVQTTGRGTSPRPAHLGL